MKPRVDFRYLDLLKQGFMKPRKARRVPKVRPWITCNDCMDWHREGKHTAPADVRRANRSAEALRVLARQARSPS